MHPPPACRAPDRRAPTARCCRTRRLGALALIFALTSLPALAWWQADWTQRTRVTIDTSDKGVPMAEPVSALPVAIRLHSGNFDFLAAQPDGRDLRVLAADDKTVLPHRIERFDPSNELALVWVTLPNLAPGSDKNAVVVYAGNEMAPAAEPPPADAALRFLVRFDDAAGTDAVTRTAATPAPEREPNAVLAGGARLSGRALGWPGAQSLTVPAGSAATWSMWLRPDHPATGELLRLGSLALELEAGELRARLGSTTLAGGQVTAGAWQHVALVLEGTQVRLHLNGAEVARAAAATPALDGPLQVGAGLQGAIDELQLVAVARPAAWLVLAAAAQGSDGKLLRSQREDAASSGGDHGYIGILVRNLTVDAWVVIIILMAMFALAAVVMVGKLRFIQRTDAGNRQFLRRFREAGDNLLQLDQGGEHPHSSLYRLYLAGQRELRRRQVGEAGAPALSNASLNAVKASVDADLVRESHRLNAQMVWLTIAISGGPFLGLLGTVVGVMITFAAIAAAGDVNVNAIAPGIAAALLATVAGLGVAIPSLFGYNYLASRIKNLAADMQIFVDEFISRVAERYCAR